MNSLNIFWPTIKTLPVFRIGNNIENFNVINYLLSKGFEDIEECKIEDTLISPSVSDVFNMEIEKNFTPSKNFIKYFNNKEVRVQVKRMIYDGIKPTHPDLVQYSFEKSEANQYLQKL